MSSVPVQSAGLNMTPKLEVIRRAQPSLVWQYVAQTRKSNTRDMAVVKFTPRSQADVKEYASLLARLHKSGRVADLLSLDRPLSMSRISTSSHSSRMTPFRLLWNLFY